VAGAASPVRLKAKPDRIFVSVDQSTARSTISFAPAASGDPIQHDQDLNGALAMRDAKAIADAYPGSSIHGPHFHAARPAGRRRMMRRPPNQGSGDNE